MDRVEITVHRMLSAIEAPLYDVGVLSDRGMLPGLDGISAEEVLKRISLLLDGFQVSSGYIYEDRTLRQKRVALRPLSLLVAINASSTVPGSMHFFIGSRSQGKIVPGPNRPSNC